MVLLNTYVSMKLYYIIIMLEKRFFDFSSTSNDLKDDSIIIIISILKNDNRYTKYSFECIG